MMHGSRIWTNALLCPAAARPPKGAGAGRRRAPAGRPRPLGHPRLAGRSAARGRPCLAATSAGGGRGRPACCPAPSPLDPASPSRASTALPDPPARPAAGAGPLPVLAGERPGPAGGLHRRPAERAPLERPVRGWPERWERERERATGEGRRLGRRGWERKDRQHAR
ncbi:hypothetical protein PVAP13_1NG101988 [Panicum virgatum]|uniref:Uncharacterized protein n=1 Tax=Panicum virgatum TaxID=38727 RepID=A0A8T0WJY1_PANVG|nr:hypothetical protein PVAP13_1NG101988 [Panicum virgatum]